jgi:Acetyltransferase (GNAT) family
MTVGEIARLCNEHLVLSFESMANAMPNGNVKHFGGATLVRTGLPDAAFNMVFLFESCGSQNELFRGIRSSFIEALTPWEIVTNPSGSPELTSLIQEFGLVKVEQQPGMFLDAVPEETPKVPTGFEIKQVSDIEVIRVMLGIGMTSFGNWSGAIPEPMATALSGTMLPARPSCYLGYFEERPVATSIRLSAHGVAGIYFVGTLPEFRRRGFGEAMTWRAVIDGKKEGCIHCCLQASQLGRPIYERMGFRRVIDYEIWRPVRVNQY